MTLQSSHRIGSPRHQTLEKQEHRDSGVSPAARLNAVGFLRVPGVPPTLPAVTVMGRKRCVGADCSKMAAGCCGVKKQKLSGSPGSGGPGGVGAGSGVAGSGHCGSELGIGSSATVAAAGSVSRVNGLGGAGGSGGSSGGSGGGGGTSALSPAPAGYSSSGLSPNLSTGPGSGSGGRKMVVSAEMCCFCFDVLYCHLYGYQPPRTPRFTNDP